MEVKASLKFVRVGDQKARIVADMIRGKMVNDAIRILTFDNKKPSEISADQRGLDINIYQG